MSKHDTISVLQASMIMVTAAGILDHVIVIPILLQTAARDSWISVLLAGILLLAWIPLLYFVMKRSSQQHLFIWLKQRVGTGFASVLIALILIELFLMCTMTIRDVSHWANITYLPMTPNLILVVSFLVGCFYLVNSGLRSIAIVNGILLPIVVLLGIFVMTANFVHKDYALLFPLFENGNAAIVKAMIYAGSGFTGMIYFVFVQHRLRTKMKLLPLLITGILLVELTVSPLTGAIAIFGPDEAARMRFPAYEQWRLVTFGHFLEHVDFFSIYQWLVGGFIRISLGMFMIIDLLRLPQGKKRNLFLGVLFVLMIAVTQIPISDKTFMTLLKTVYLPYSLLFVVALSAVFAAIAWRQSKKKVES